jgi:sporulation protein YlmC with PRC-barrel domain
MNVKRVLFFLICITLAFTLFSAGETEQASEQAVNIDLEQSFLRSVRAGSLIETKIEDTEGREIGTVRDIVVDVNRGSVIYYVVGFSGLSSVDSDNLYPVPLYLFDRRKNTGNFVFLLEDLQFLEDALTVEDAQQYRTGDETTVSGWRVSSNTFWQNSGVFAIDAVQKRYSEISQGRYSYGTGARLAPVSIITYDTLTNQSIYNLSEEPAGSITDLLIDTRSGKVHYTVFSPRSNEYAMFSAHLIPLSAYRLDSDSFMIYYPISEYGLNESSGIKGDIESMVNADWYRSNQGYWNMIETGFTVQSGMRTVPALVFPVSEFIGYSVLNLQQEGLGEIVDFTVSREGGITYAVVEFDQILGLGGKRTLVPIAALDFSPHSQTVQIGFTMDDFRNIPSFDTDRYPDTGELGWDSSIEEYWNGLFLGTPSAMAKEIPTAASVSDISNPQQVFASDLKSFEVRNESGTLSAHIDTVILNPLKKDYSYAVLAVGGFLDIGDKSFAVAFDAFTWKTEQNTLMLDVERTEFEDASGIEEGEWPERPNPRWTRK